MGEAGVQRQERAVFRPLVAFDFDGTLTSRDSFIEFLTWRHGRAAFVAGLARLGFSGLNYLLHRDRGRLKARFIKEFLGGVSRTELETEAQAFAGQRGRALLRPDAFRAHSAGAAGRGRAADHLHRQPETSSSAPSPAASARTS